MNAGEVFQLKYLVEPDGADSAVVWSSDAPDVASVDQNGNVKALKDGTATITVKTANGECSARCVVTVGSGGQSSSSQESSAVEWKPDP